MNPNNVAYHQARGAQCRPGDWQNIVEQRRVQGQREHALNLAAAETKAHGAARGRDTARVERVVKETLGGQAQVWKAGSRAKRDGLANADLDLKIMTDRPLRAEDRAAFGAGLSREFGSSRVSDSNPRIHKVAGDGGEIDIVPCDAVYFGKGFNAGKPRNGFTYNPQARLAVRDVKLQAQEKGEKVKGHDVESAVLRAQQQRQRGGFATLSAFAVEELFK